MKIFGKNQISFNLTASLRQKERFISLNILCLLVLEDECALAMYLLAWNSFFSLLHYFTHLTYDYPRALVYPVLRVMPGSLLLLTLLKSVYSGETGMCHCAVSVQSKNIKINKKIDAKKNNYKKSTVAVPISLLLRKSERI
jgi:hypothetical protein